jgi:hypothetical protein
MKILRILSVLLITSFLNACGSGKPALTVFVIDKDGDPIDSAYVQIGNTAISGVTDSAGKITLEDNSLSNPVQVNVGKSGYRNYTIQDVTKPEIRVTLSEFSPAHGYIRVSIDEATWGSLSDNCPIPPNPPCILRFAIIFVPDDDISNTYDLRDCQNCLSQDIGVIPFDPKKASIVEPARFGEGRVFAVGGLLDFSTFTITLSKFGIKDFLIDSNNTAANPLDVMIPLAYSITDTTSMTINVSAAMPEGNDRLTEFFALNLPNYGLGIMGAFSGASLGGEKISDNSYRFRGLSVSEVASESLLADASYIVIGGYSNSTETAQSFRVSSDPIADSAQEETIDSLFYLPSGLSPANNSTISADNAVISWNAVEGAALYMVQLSRPFFNGLSLDERVIWEIIIPSVSSALTLPIFTQGDLQKLESCQFYHLKVYALSPANFVYDDGVYPRFHDIIFDHMPSLHSMNTTTFFTEGENCGPIISNVDRFEGAGGDEMTLYGKYFGTAQGTSTVTFDSTPAADFTFWSDDKITLKVPAGTSNEIVKVKVTVNGVESNYAYFKYY